jgi:hypothetical protein
MSDETATLEEQVIELLDGAAPRTASQIAKALGTTLDATLKEAIVDMVDVGLLSKNVDKKKRKTTFILVPEALKPSEAEEEPAAEEPAAEEPAAEEPPVEEPPVEKVNAEVVDSDEGTANYPAVPAVARKMWEQDSGALTLSGISSELTIEERKGAVRTGALATKVMEDRLGLVAGELLYEIKKRSYFTDWGFESFEDYVESELQFKKRKATYLIDIYQKFVVELGLEIDDLKDLEWSKAKEVLSFIDKGNKAKVLKKLRSSTFNEIREYSKKMRSKGKGGDTTYKRLSLTLTDDQYANVTSALEIMGKVAGTDNNGSIIDAICAEWLAAREDDEDDDDMADRVDKIIANVERIHGIELVPAE